MSIPSESILNLLFQRASSGIQQSPLFDARGAFNPPRLPQSSLPFESLAAGWPCHPHLLNRFPRQAAGQSLLTVPNNCSLSERFRGTMNAACLVFPLDGPKLISTFPLDLQRQQKGT